MQYLLIRAEMVDLENGIKVNDNKRKFYRLAKTKETLSPERLAI